MQTIELLAPARDLECGLAAINCGADAVYIGAGRFGARERAGNNLADIAALVQHAHRYWAKVYATVNTLLRDEEIPQALELISELYDAGVDGLIIQDVGLLECSLPPLPLIASTQMHNHTPERVAFLEKLGFQRAILARELCLDEIRAIRRGAPSIELEFFVHGALCVSYSGQCYLSYALGGRSGNRGQCAQPCRKKYDLVDSKGRVIEKEKHLLSLRDLNLSEHLEELIDAGISSFKIEGRLKDRSYVMNVVSEYRKRLDQVLREKDLQRSSSGNSKTDFVADLGKTFNRGYTDHFLHGRKDKIGSIDTPKMIGEVVGRVSAVAPREFKIKTDLALHPGDGISFFSRGGELGGTSINSVRGDVVSPYKMEGIEKGTVIYRNHDHEFLTRLEKSRIERKIGVRLALCNRGDDLLLTAEDEDGVRAEQVIAGEWQRADKPEQALANILKQLGKGGDTEFICSDVTVELNPMPFLAVAALNGIRREILDLLRISREQNRPVLKRRFIRNNEPLPQKELTFEGNVLNQKAKAFYQCHGVTKIEPAAESGLNLRGRKVMTTKYCLKHQMGSCPKDEGEKNVADPLYLIDEEGNRLKLKFNCAKCLMEVYMEEKGRI